MTDLLPPATPPLVRVLDDTLAAGAADLVCPLPDALRPETAPPAVLPYLAWGRSVDLWWADMATDERRAAVEVALPLHRLKGTAAGIRAHVARAGGTVTGITAPPVGFHVTGDPAENDARYDRWLATLPEIRLYTMRDGGTLTGLATWDGADDLVVEPAFLGAETGDAATFFAGELPPRLMATLVRDGTEVPIAFWRRQDPRWGRQGVVTDFAWPGEAGLGLWADDAASADRVLDGAPAVQPFVSLALGAAADDAWNLVAPIAPVQDVAPRIGTTFVEDRIGCYGDDFWAGQHLDEVDPPRATWLSVRILERADLGYSAGGFLDHDLTGLPPYTAWIGVDIRLPPEPDVLYANACFLDAAFAAKAGKIEVLERVCDAVAAAKALRDDVLIDLDQPTRRSLSARRWVDVDLSA